jgi:hypothetical protein
MMIGFAMKTRCPLPLYLHTLAKSGDRLQGGLQGMERFLKRLRMIEG